jgi:hypothetical protein
MATRTWNPHLPYDRWQKPRSCYTAAGNPKRRYRSQGAADREARRIEERQGAPMHGYRCDVCGWFHCGHEPVEG